MRKKRQILPIIIIALLPMLSGCPDKKTVTTSVKTDGSCLRTLGEFDPRSFKGIDSIKSEVPIPIDNSWELQKVNDSTAYLWKEYSSVEELNSAYSLDHSELKIYDRKTELNKKFRWFYTSMIYSETYGGLLTDIPLSNYLSEQEIECFKMEDPKSHPMLAGMEPRAIESLLDNIDERLGLWLNYNIFLMAFDDIVAIGDTLGILDRNEVSALNLKDSLEQEWHVTDNDLLIFSENQSEMMTLAENIGTYIDMDSADILKFKSRVSNALLDDKYQNQLFADLGNEHFNQLIMPGQLIDTNAELIEGDTMIWQMSSIKFIDSDFTMFAESRLTNWWAYIVSGFILLIALIIPFVANKKA